MVKEIAKKLGVDAANVLISWQVRSIGFKEWRRLLMWCIEQIQRGAATLPKSVTPERIKSNLETISLPAEDFAKLEEAATANPGSRVVNPASSWGVESKLTKSHTVSVVDALASLRGRRRAQLRQGTICDIGYFGYQLQSASQKPAINDYTVLLLTGTIRSSSFHHMYRLVSSHKRRNHLPWLLCCANALRDSMYCRGDERKNERCDARG